MKEIQTNGKTILFVEVPEDAKEFKIENGLLLFKATLLPFGIVIPPPGQYQILGKSTELSEEQMEEICPKCVGIDVYPDYNYKATRLKALNFFNTVQESYLSLLEANGIVDRVNKSEPNIDDYCYAGSMKLDDWAVTEYEKELNKYQEAQSKVKHYLVLEKI